MKIYEIVFSTEASADFATSIQWGCENWGEEETWRWYREMKSKIVRVLSTSPLGWPIAPDNAEYEVEVRQMSIGRYRILFNVNGNIITILHIRAPYAGDFE